MNWTRHFVVTLLAVLFTAGSALAEESGHAADAGQAVHDAAQQVDTYAGETADSLEHYNETAGEHGEAHGGGHGNRGLTTVVWQEALYTIIVFGIFFVVLSIFVWPKILAALQAREDKVRGDLKNAEDAAKQASATLAEYKQQLAEAQKQAQQIVDESRGAAQKVAAQLKDEAQAQITQMKERAEADINAAKERAVSDIYEQGATLATQVAGQILRREINAADQSALIKESIDKLRSADRN
ncbi:MAG: F0F1 ATP synthase subunit B [Phycisphaerales bacterium]